MNVLVFEEAGRECGGALREDSKKIYRRSLAQYRIRSIRIQSLQFEESLGIRRPERSDYERHARSGRVCGIVDTQFVLQEQGSTGAELLEENESLKQNCRMHGRIFHDQRGHAGKAARSAAIGCLEKAEAGKEKRHETQQYCHECRFCCKLLALRRGSINLRRGDRCKTIR